MGRDTIQLETAVSTISQEHLLEFTSEYGISEDLHPELPGPKERIVDFPEGKVSVYTKFFEFANFRLPISQFLFDILGHYKIHLSQLLVIGATKVSHFEINCRVVNIVPTLNLFHMDLFNLIRAPNPTKVKIGTHPRAAYEVSLLTITASRVIEKEDPAVATESFGTPSTIV
nr:transposase (putative), gypsy type [Tanacetum cinerariifolium]